MKDRLDTLRSLAQVLDIAERNACGTAERQTIRRIKQETQAELQEICGSTHNPFTRILADSLLRAM